MKLLYPLGLLGLIGIPLLIIIYILRNRYSEKTISSTFIWDLSERFNKKKNPIDKLNGLWQLILQCFVIAFLSLCIAHPVFVIKNGAVQYVFIVDESASMGMRYEGETRFDAAIAKITKEIKSSRQGCSYTIITADDDPRILIEKEENKDVAIEMLKTLKFDQASYSVAGAINIAQSLFDEDPSYVIYLVTDKSYEETPNINLWNMSRGEENYAVLSAYHEDDNGLSTTFTANVISYDSDARLRIELYIDGKFKTMKNVDFKKGVEQKVSLKDKTTSFSSFEIRIQEGDALDQDNTYAYYKDSVKAKFKTLIVSDNPFYLESMIDVISTGTTRVIKPHEYNKDRRGYDLYIFDGISFENPELVPTDGNIWFINTLAPSQVTNLIYTKDVIMEETAALGVYSEIEGNEIFDECTKNLLKNDIYVARYSRFKLNSDNFTTLVSYDNDPLILVGTTAYGNRQAILTFDLHDSNLPIIADFMVLCSNLVDFSIPTIVNQTNYKCGETMYLNIVNGLKDVSITSPSEEVKFLDYEIGDTTMEYVLSEAGSYTINAKIGDTDVEYKVFSTFPTDESNPNISEEFIVVGGQPATSKHDALIDILYIVAAIAAVLFIVDWGVYCYEQHQA